MQALLATSTVPIGMHCDVHVPVENRVGRGRKFFGQLVNMSQPHPPSQIRVLVKLPAPQSTLQEADHNVHCVHVLGMLPEHGLLSCSWIPESHSPRQLPAHNRVRLLVPRPQPLQGPHADQEVQAVGTCTVQFSLWVSMALAAQPAAVLQLPSHKRLRWRLPTPQSVEQGVYPPQDVHAYGTPAMQSRVSLWDAPCVHDPPPQVPWQMRWRVCLPAPQLALQLP